MWPEDDAAARFLEGRGHVLDAQPMAMAHDLDGVERPDPDALPDWTADGDFAEVGPLNDRAYPFGTDSFTRALQHAPADGTHVYLARDERRAGRLPPDDRPRRQQRGQMVAVPPEARGRGISGNLLRHALADAARARHRDLHAGRRRRSALRSTSGLGFRPLGRASMWEFRPDA